ncbi:hypothetical protein AZE41_02910 [Sporosarcina psychrophila]|nr:hypothetical protein AZE41_02910 [Sporosarcina psychrophila]
MILLGSHTLPLEGVSLGLRNSVYIYASALDEFGVTLKKLNVISDILRAFQSIQDVIRKASN